MNLKIVPYIIIIILMLLLFLQRECHRCPEPTEIVRVDTVYRYDSIPYTAPPMTPKPGTVIEQPIPAGIDSLAVARAYFSRRMGIDTLVNDSLYMLSLRWEVQENKPTLFQPTIINRQPTTIISHTPVEKAKNKVFVGFTVNRLPSDYGLSASLALLTKRENLYTVSYDLRNKDVQAGIYWKIKFKKK